MAEATTTETHQEDSKPSQNTSKPLNVNPRNKDCPIETYFEIQRIAADIVSTILQKSKTKKRLDGFLCRIALQFPDELLSDSAEVCWLLEDEIRCLYTTEFDRISESIMDEDPSVTIDLTSPSWPPLVFVLGDTTYASCCPDEIGALHLSADLIVHYGHHACLSPSESLPVIYSFGFQDWSLDGMKDCCQQIQEQEASTTEIARYLVLFEVRYSHLMELFMEVMKETLSIEHVVLGHVPSLEETMLNAGSEGVASRIVQRSSCCGGKDDCNDKQESQVEQNVCCNSSKIGSECTESTLLQEEARQPQSENNAGCSIGGLKVKLDSSDLSKYTLLYIGDNSGNSKSRQFLNTLLKCTSPQSSTQHCWSYDPSTRDFHPDPTSILGVSRFLNRRFYLTQRAQIATRMGILVGTLSQRRFQNVVSTLRHKIQESGRACYTFVVGKINVAKLANFAEVECFVLVSCGETSVMQDEREFHVPVITPMELDIALGETDWNGSGSCSTDFNDFLGSQEEEFVEDTPDEIESQLRNNLLIGEKLDDDGEQESNDDENGCSDDSSSEDDEPYFSMISGTYVTRPKSKKIIEKERQRRLLEEEKEKDANDTNWTNEPGKGQLTQYNSEAAEFWKKREYKGLEANVGKDEAKAATLGQTGIASDYGK